MTSTKENSNEEEFVDEFSLDRDRKYVRMEENLIRIYAELSDYLLETGLQDLYKNLVLADLAEMIYDRVYLNYILDGREDSLI